MRLAFDVASQLFFCDSSQGGKVLPCPIKSASLRYAWFIACRLA